MSIRDFEAQRQAAPIENSEQDNNPFGVLGASLPGSPEHEDYLVGEGAEYPLSMPVPPIPDDPNMRGLQQRFDDGVVPIVFDPSTAHIRGYDGR